MDFQIVDISLIQFPTNMNADCKAMLQAVRKLKPTKAVRYQPNGDSLATLKNRIWGRLISWKRRGLISPDISACITEDKKVAIYIKANSRRRKMRLVEI